MILYTVRARSQVRTLGDYYERLGRDEAIDNLRSALLAAEDRIGREPHKGLSAPRPYPDLHSPGRLWIKEGSYWVAYRASPAPTILGVFHERANIPGRV